jgi:uncharacterized phage protein (TIGR02218 family)
MRAVTLTAPYTLEQFMALLNGPVFYMADLYTITPLWGMPAAPPEAASLYYTSAGRSISTGLEGGPGPWTPFLISRSGTKVTRGLEVDELDLTINPKPTDLINGVAWLTAAALNGQLDGAAVRVQRAFFAAPTDTIPMGRITLFVGNIADGDYSATECRLKVKSWIEVLNRSWPRNLYQSGCLLNLYSTDCGVVQATYTVTDTAEAGSLPSNIKVTRAEDTGYFARGVIACTSGANAGQRRTVKHYIKGTPGQIRVANPFLSAWAVGDGFTLYPGCNKSKATCADKFNNLANFRGTPYVPVPETVA